MARPMATRWRWPPESCLGRRSINSVMRRISAARLHPPLGVGLRIAGHPQAEAQILLDGHVRIERVGLEHHGDAAIGRLDIVHHLAADGDLAAADVLEPGDHPEQRRFSAAGRADEDDEFAVLDVDVGAMDDLDRRRSA